MTLTNPDARLPRTDIASVLTDAGYPISPATLAGFGTRGGGPPYEIFNRRALYQVGPTLAWAKSRVRPGGRRATDQRPQHAA